MEIKPAVILDCNESVARALAEIAKSRSCVVVTKDGRYAGIIDDRVLANFSSDASAAKLSTFVHKAPVIDEDATLSDACRLFFSGPYKALPVVKNGKVEGIVRRMELLLALLDSGALAGRKAYEVMSKGVITIDENATIAQAKAKMRKVGMKRLVVVKKDGSATGVISNYDIVTALGKPKDRLPFVKEKIGIEEHPVSSFMSSEIVGVKEGATLGECVHKMIGGDVSSVVVLKSGMPVGMVSARDIIESALVYTKPGIHVSGLREEEKGWADDIKADCSKLIEKIGKSIRIDYLALHIKKTGEAHSVMGRLKTARGVVSAGASDFSFPKAVRNVLSELEGIVRKSKPEPLHKLKKMGRRRFRGKP